MSCILLAEPLTGVQVVFNIMYSFYSLKRSTAIFGLGTGHCRLYSHLKRIGVKTSAQCPCGEADQTPEHGLQSCSLYEQGRQQIWPTCVSLKTKLWGSAEDLFLTFKCEALTGKRIIIIITITMSVFLPFHVKHVQLR